MTTPRFDFTTALKGPVVPALETAVILTAGWIFDEASSHRQSQAEPVGALTQVGGLSLIQRTVLTLQRAGITRMVVLSDHEEEAIRRSLSGDPRITAQMRWTPVREFPPQDARTWEALVGDISGSCLVMSIHTVFSKGLIEQLRREVQNGESILAVAHTLEVPSRYQALEEMLVFPASLLSGSPGGAFKSEPGESPLRRIVHQASAEGCLRIVATGPEAAYWPIRTVADAAAVERRLFRSLKSDLDGLIDTYFNRRVSGALTRLFLKFRWSPNAITLLSIFIGLAAALFVSLGNYVAGVIGALLFQLSAIVDCCDGDVARLTFKESRFGGQLDLFGDNAVHMAIFAGIAWAGYHQTQSFVPLGLGAAAILGNAFSLWFVTRLKGRPEEHRSGSSIPLRSESILKHMANRDFSVVVLLFALVDSLGVFLWLAAIGSHLFWMYTVWATRPPTPRA